MMELFEQAGKKVALAAMTGCAAELLGGETLHSILKLGAVSKVGNIVAGKCGRKRAERLGVLDVLIVDEVSMLSAELFQHVEESITACRRTYLQDRLEALAGPDDGPAASGGRGGPAAARIRAQLAAPLCGLQLILVGDFLQLPPISPDALEQQKEVERAVENLDEKLLKRDREGPAGSGVVRRHAAGSREFRLGRYRLVGQAAATGLTNACVCPSISGRAGLGRAGPGSCGAAVPVGTPCEGAVQGVYGCLRCERGLHSAPAGPCRDGKLTGRQIRNAAPVCNRGWCFQSVAWRRLDLHVAVFKQVHRQRDREFISLLHAIRDGSAQRAQLDRLWRLCSRPLPHDDGVQPTHLFCKNMDAGKRNASELAQLPTEQHSFPAALRVVAKRRRGEEPCGPAVAARERKLRLLLPDLKKDRKVKDPLILRVGAQVMCTANVGAGLVNGSRGVVVGFVDCREQLAELQRKLASLQAKLHRPRPGAATAALAGALKPADAHLALDPGASSSGAAAGAAAAAAAAGEEARGGSLDAPAALCAQPPALGPGRAAAAEAATPLRAAADPGEPNLPVTQPLGSAAAAREAEQQAAAVAAAAAAGTTAAALCGVDYLAQAGKDGGEHPPKRRRMAGAEVPLPMHEMEPPQAAAPQAGAADAAVQTASPERPAGFMLASERLVQQEGEEQGQGQQRGLARSGPAGRGAGRGAGGGPRSAPAAAPGVALPEWDGSYESWPDDHLPVAAQVACAKREIRVLTDFIRQHQQLAEGPPRVQPGGPADHGDSNPLRHIPPPDLAAVQFYASGANRAQVVGDGQRGPFPLPSDFPGHAEAYYRCMQQGPAGELRVEEVPQLLGRWQRQQAEAQARQAQHGQQARHAWQQQGWPAQGLWQQQAQRGQQQQQPAQQHQGHQAQQQQQQQHGQPPHGAAPTPPARLSGTATQLSCWADSSGTSHGPAGQRQQGQQPPPPSQQGEQQQPQPALLLAPPVRGPVALAWPPGSRLLQVHSAVDGQLSAGVAEDREVLRGCATLDALVSRLRIPLRLDEALDVELWMLDASGSCVMVGASLSPAAVLDAAAGLVLHVRLE